MNDVLRFVRSRPSMAGARGGLAGVIAAALLAGFGGTTAYAGTDWIPNPPPDKRPCIAGSELRALPDRQGWSRSKVERWTETRDLGDRMETPELTYYGYFYPSCTVGRRVVVYFRTLDDTLAAIHD